MYFVIFPIKELEKNHIYLYVYHFWNFKFIYEDPCYNLIYFYLTNLTISSHAGIAVIDFLTYEDFLSFPSLPFPSSLLSSPPLFFPFKRHFCQVSSVRFTTPFFSTYNTFYNFCFLKL